MSTAALPSAVATALGATGQRAGIHGHTPWGRVGEAGLFLAGREAVSTHVVLLFAILHDCRRENDGHDPGHGPRAAALTEGIGHAPLGLAPADLTALCHAMRLHDRGQVSDHPLVGTCWDADRLDLPRVGIRPDPRLMSTAGGRDPAVMAAFADPGRIVPTWGDLARDSAAA